jgi:hypothetical protein
MTIVTLALNALTELTTPKVVHLIAKSAPLVKPALITFSFATTKRDRALTVLVVRTVPLRVLLLAPFVLMATRDS